MKSFQRRWVVGVVGVVVAAVAVFAVWQFRHDQRQYRHDQQADCEKVHVLDSYNRWFQDGVARASEDGKPTSIDGYREWSAELHRFADDIGDAQLKPKAESVADLADRYVKDVMRLQPELPAATDAWPSSSPVWHEASRIGHGFNDAIFDLTESCPIS